RVMGGKSLDKCRQSRTWPAAVRTLLHVAAGWFYLNDDTEGRQLLEEARLLLFHGELAKKEQTDLACTYIATLSQAPVELALHAIDELLAQLARVYDNYLTRSHYSVAKLRGVGAIVLTVATEEFAM